MKLGVKTFDDKMEWGVSALANGITCEMTTDIRGQPNNCFHDFHVLTAAWMKTTTIVHHPVAMVMRYHLDDCDMWPQHACPHALAGMLL